jgi:hypothetical protein
MAVLETEVMLIVVQAMDLRDLNGGDKPEGLRRSRCNPHTQALQRSPDFERKEE